MAEGILGLGQGQAGALNNDMLEKLKAVDRKATVEPIEKKLEKFDLEREAITNISTKVEDLLSAVKLFSLNQTTSVNAFNQKSASVMGDGVIFDAPDLNLLKNGSMRVQVQKLAQKDVWQSNPISGSKTDTVNAGIITINVKNIDTSTMSYTKLTEEINKISGVQASLVDSSDGKFRLAIKSTETGTANKINFDSSSGKISDGAAKLFGSTQKDEWQTAINVSGNQTVDTHTHARARARAHAHAHAHAHTVAEGTTGNDILAVILRNLTAAPTSSGSHLRQLLQDHGKASAPWRCTYTFVNGTLTCF